MKLLDTDDILPLDNQINEKNSLMFLTVFTLYIVGGIGSGKTTVLINMLINKRMLAGVFNNLFWVSPTMKLDRDKFKRLEQTSGVLTTNTKLRNLIEKDKLTKFKSNSPQLVIKEEPESTAVPSQNFLEEPSVELIEQLIEEQTRMSKKYGKGNIDKILLVLDDCISVKDFFKNKKMNKLITTCRHYKISVCILSQDWFSLPKILRNNMTGVIVFPTGNEKEVEAIYRSNNCNITYQQFKEIFKWVCKQKDGFLVINNRNKNGFKLQYQFKRYLKID